MKYITELRAALVTSTFNCDCPKGMSWEVKREACPYIIPGHNGQALSLKLFNASGEIPGRGIELPDRVLCAKAFLRGLTIMSDFLVPLGFAALGDEP